MKLSEIIRGVYLGVTFVSIALVMTSCDYNNRENGNGCDAHESSTNAAVVAEAPKVLTQVERLEAECRNFVVDVKQLKGDAWSASCDLCNEICKLPKEDALPLLDRWIEMAIEQPVTNANRSTALVVRESLFHMVLCSFIASQNLRANSFEEWDRIFHFFSKYTDEITAVEKRVQKQGCPQWSPSYTYLQDLQVPLENWIYITKTVFSNTLSKGLTKEQKADILRRLDEVKKYTVPPPHSPFSK